MNQLDINTLKSIIPVLTGYHVKFQNLHWAAINNSYHSRIDDFNDILCTAIDEIGEIIQGLTEQFMPDEFANVDMPEENNPLSLLYNLKMEFLQWVEQIKSAQSTNYDGLLDECGVFLHSIDKYMYLFRLCKD